MVKNLPANAGDAGLIPGSGRSPGEGNSNAFQYSCLGNPMDRRVWWATVHAVTKELDLTWELNNNNKDTTRGSSNIAVKKEIKYGSYKLDISLLVDLNNCLTLENLTY